ncbi:MAG: TIGR00300 family protein [Acidimicrobiales bacterium]
MATETVELHGHIIDSLLLAKVLDLIVEAGADYRIAQFDLGRSTNDPSTASIEITAGDDVDLDALLEELQVHGANRARQTDAALVAADHDGVLPAGFYSTTNLDTEVRIDGTWHAAENPEMDCGIVVAEAATSVRTLPMHRVRAGDLVVVGQDGVRVTAPAKPRDQRAFEFMSSEVSSEKPKALAVDQVVACVQAAKAAGGKVLAVCGPAVVHTGGGPDVARLVRAGVIDVLFAGNGFATHDMESNVLGTSLGVSVSSGAPTEGGHSNHLRVINEIRRHGSIAAAVAAGFVRGGAMYECVTAGVPFVLGGSVRDDGPLPDTMTDVVAAADAMRALVPGVTVALMLASTLHAIATGNLLPAGVETFCIDINPAVVTKLADRGSHQAMGIVTDVGPFLHQLAERLC